MPYSMLYKSPVKNLEIISDGSNITHVLYKHDTSTLSYPEKPDLKVFQSVTRWLDDYFLGNNPTIDFPLAPSGTDFQKSVWKILQTIEYGELKTYGHLAQEVGRQLNKPKMSAQAVGGAVGRNPISIIIPCHRIVGKDGSLTGYGGTIDNKIKLLELERVNMAQLYRPTHTTKP
ncbi:methylated-DNA--[protein]-cysteine S-methyltransferase [Staphylococcus devriesei]|uniref:Methylated-DNA--protein-cysteine methyltransferase n=1 Tax=Staphylococcus devriesei TaxID=586733 RepID=A0A2K4DQU0_9STAP|nr:methylated-DNA--[protein]-cysteine S-methyltransferase [Staphylococcus devriesei]MCE5097013.1 methylated-DNA--[protein]-cysteine S-methyltransferase [Staphylococcus devriesei]PNZ89190.1 methylated-DNA--[protein]-cysteine S-methyltransferase [Staphylococcus devriesei]PTF04867.1 methylated-DNA--[protein]-cysteine S-methyltransferase [Staphylococcus devriesei]PTF14937.1 methylated-DNA--[protein]-cysteine S-methyltransferase [Staphylococcus devriesei]PTF16779.1 methylated-DNA--[protein]-cystein